MIIIAELVDITTGLDERVEDLELEDNGNEKQIPNMLVKYWPACQSNILTETVKYEILDCI